MHSIRRTANDQSQATFNNIQMAFTRRRSSRTRTVKAGSRQVEPGLFGLFGYGVQWPPPGTRQVNLAGMSGCVWHVTGDASQ